MNNPYYEGIFVYDITRDRIDIVSEVYEDIDLLGRIALIFTDKSSTHYLSIEEMMSLYKPLGDHAQAVRLLYGK
jgi:hypothetical protein